MVVAVAVAAVLVIATALLVATDTKELSAIGLFSVAVALLMEATTEVAELLVTANEELAAEVRT